MNVDQSRYFEIEDDKFVQSFANLQDARKALRPGATLYAVEKIVVQTERRVVTTIIKDVVKG